MTKLNASGSALAYSTFLGGTSCDQGQRHRGGRKRQGLRDGVHRLRRLPHHPRRLRQNLQRRSSDAFVTKLNASGSALAYSTFLGGTE